MIHTKYKRKISNDEPFDFRAGFYHVDLSNAIHIDKAKKSYPIIKIIYK
jgi:hypothetical protein